MATNDRTAKGNKSARSHNGFAKPFDGAVSRYFRKGAPKAVRQAIERAGGDEILTEGYPYPGPMSKSDYEAEYDACQLELAKLQRWVRDTGRRVALVFEGRDAAGKGGAIRRLTENLNPRQAPVVALPAPSDTERTEWYFQRYVANLPSAGEIVIFDRSWYNRAVVEKVFGFCTDEERAAFFEQLPYFEAMLRHDGITLIKIWLAVGRAEQLRRFLDRERDPLKQWKLSEIDVKGLALWDEYTTAVGEMFERSHSPGSPWTVILAEDKRRARIAVMRKVLETFDYPGKKRVEADPKIAIDPDVLAALTGRA
ncbi:polyphosphate kinase 2 [Amaricoccus sp.]|uniref:polyphosphate kinase 2 n=1 Tax=Amaricoccus sp. TaxID=1872485 RepID=UPI001B63F798|nr:polyphosphate kinase 2 [Amaricoccus sp.]MBP7242220.1 polyphosphate kinase 2 [Amaricoccus sp.]